MDEDGCTRISRNLEDLPLHRDFILIDSLQEVEQP
jgi:hypothetical protein